MGTSGVRNPVTKLDYPDWPRCFLAEFCVEGVSRAGFRGFLTHKQQDMSVGAESNSLTEGGQSSETHILAEIPRAWRQPPHARGCILRRAEGIGVSRIGRFHRSEQPPGNPPSTDKAGLTRIPLAVPIGGSETRLFSGIRLARRLL